MNKSRIEQKLEEQGIELPTPPKPVAAYVPTMQTGNLVYTSGQLPLVEGELQYKGKVGQDVSLEEGYEAAKICTINCLSVIKAHIGDLDKIKKFVKVNGFVSSADNFNQQPKVINGASEFLGEIFEDKGEHARAAVGVNELPINTPVELEMIVEVED